MTRLIDADALKTKAIRCETFKLTDAPVFLKAVGTKEIDRSPAIDAVPVVRCKDCKHYEIHKPKVLENCERNGYIIPMKPDDFCAYGERKEGDGNG